MAWTLALKLEETKSSSNYWAKNEEETPSNWYKTLDITVVNLLNPMVPIK